MIRNYIKIAFRSLKKDLLFSFINVFGLMTGLAAFILIALYVFDEYTYDSFHDRADSIYRIVDNFSVDGKQTRIAALLLGLFTMSFQATKVALANPAKTLKTQ